MPSGANPNFSQIWNIGSIVSIFTDSSADTEIIDTATNILNL